MANKKIIVEEAFAWANMTENEIKAITNNIKNKLSDHKENILKIEIANLNFRNFIHASEDVSSEISRLDAVLFGFVNLSTDEKIRNVGREVELEVSKILTEFAYDEDMYKQFVSYYEGNYKKEKKNLTDEEVKIVEDTAKGYKRMGMHLSKRNKKILLDKKNKINKLAQEFDVLTVKNYEKGLWFKKEELRGIPEDNFKSFKYDDKKKQYFLNCSGRDDLGTDYPLIKKYCEVAKTREKATIYNEFGVGDKNTKKLAQILKLRFEITKMIGYKTWADLSMSDEMMNDPSKVNKFLIELIKKLNKDYSSYNKSLEKVLKEKGEKLSSYSYAYAENLLRKSNLPVKEEEYKPYFELEKVLQVLFSSWKKYFDIEVKVIPQVSVFHPDTKALSFHDRKSGEFLGYGVLDLYPRAGKYGHACVADIFKKYVDRNGVSHPGFTFLICNFKKALDGKTFISLSDMNTLYHEAGHMLHMILMKNKYISSSSTSRDFVEIPSQFHENFLLNEKFVKENFKHFETGKTMKKILVENIRNMTSKGEARTWIRVSFCSLYDQEIHGKNILKYANNFKLLDKVFNEYSRKYSRVPTSTTSHFPSTWGHLVGGYDAKYYSYVISRVYAQDFWYEFSKNGIKKNKICEKYKKFLEGANTRPEKDLVKDFLNRKVNIKPFLDTLK